jgi:outer membrane protein
MEIKLMYRKVSIFSLLLLIPALAFSQNVNKTINLEKAVELALERNISITLSKNNVESQKSTYQSAIGDFLPSLNASGSFGRNHNWSKINSGTAYSATNSYSGSVSSNLTIFNGFANMANISRTNSSIQASESNYKRTQQGIIYQTHQLFLNLVTNFQLLKVNEENLKRSRRQLERIEETNKVGSASLADVYRQRVTTANDELALINAQNNFDNAKSDMELFLSLDNVEKYEYDFTSVPSDIDTVEFASINQEYQNLDELVKKAIQTRPDYLSAVQSLNISDASLTIARSGVYPTVSASASYGVGDREYSKITDNRNLNLGVGVSLPIFSGFQTQTAIDQAKISKRNAEDQLKQTERQVKVDIEKARLDLEATQKQIRVTQTSVMSAEMDRRIAEEKYNLGAGTLLDLLIASSNYVNTQSNKVNAVDSYLLAKKQMEFVLGTITN